jgi:D-alanyl-lipoteichoic acid acyltransferase DltB (MBOAT superfamily)
MAFFRRLFGYGFGMSKLFGMDLLRNFNYPYFSRDIAEFWRRWHISLSSWFEIIYIFRLGGIKALNETSAQCLSSL